MTLQIGETVGPYRVTAQLGQGGMATVYKAYHAGLDRYVAIKVLHQAFTADPAFLARFQREARVLAKLEHPHIVPIYDFSQHEGQPYLVMKYVEGDTLKSRLSRGRLSPEETLKVVEAVGSALSYAHKQGILHRDIKPSNIIITPDDQYYLSDFGLARIADVGESTLSQDTLLGTPNYVSPEQAKGLRDLDARTDIYSFGVVLYEIIVGRVPFSGDTPFSVIHDHIYTPLPPPSSMVHDLPEPMERLLLKALAKDRADRYGDAAELVAAFHQAAGDQRPGAVAAHGQSTPPPGSADTSSVAGRKPGAAPTVMAPLPAEKQPSKSLAWLWAGLAVTAALCLIVSSLFAARAVTGLLAAPKASEVPPSAPATAAIPSIPPPTLEPLAQAQTQAASNPQDAEAHLKLAEAYYKVDKKDEAIAEINEAAALKNYSVEFYQQQVLPKLEDDPLAALDVLLPGLRRSPDNQELWPAAGKLLFEAATKDGAEAMLLKYVDQFPDQVLPGAALARYYVQHNQPSKAKTLIDWLQKEFPNEYATHFVGGEFYELTRNISRAAKEYEAVVSDKAAPVELRDAAAAKLEELKKAPATVIFKECRGYEGTITFGQSGAQAFHAFETKTFTVPPGSYLLRIDWSGRSEVNVNTTIQARPGTQVFPFGDQCR